MKTNSLSLFLVTSLLTGTAYTGTMDPVTSQPKWSWVGAISLGPVWANNGTTQTFFLTPTIEKTYISNNSRNALIDGEVFLGIQKTLSLSIQGQLGLAVAATSNDKLTGVIWDDANPLFNNFTFNYNIQHTHIALKSKLLANAGSWFIPWVSGSVGVGFNNASSFQSTPIIFESVPNPHFPSNITTTFTYTVGAGIQKALNAHWQIGVGYEFADWGKSQLGQALEQTLNTGLSLNHLYTNGVLFNLTYIA